MNGPTAQILLGQHTRESKERRLDIHLKVPLRALTARWLRPSSSFPSLSSLDRNAT